MTGNTTNHKQARRLRLLPALTSKLPWLGWCDAKLLEKVTSVKPAQLICCQQILSADFSRQQISLVSRFVFCQRVPSADFSRLLICILSADSVRRFLNSAVLIFV
jgi:hypothetical protein